MPRNGDVRYFPVAVRAAYTGSVPTSAGSWRNGTVGSGPLNTSVYVGGLWHVAHAALPWNTRSTAARRGGIKASARRNRGAETELIIQQGRQLRCDPIRPLRDEDADARIVEGALPAHLRHTDVAVPVGDGSVARVSLETDALQSIRGRNEHWQRGTIQRNNVRAVERMVSWIVSCPVPTC